MLKGVYGCIKKERDYHRIKKKKNYHATPIPPHHKRSLSELRILGSHLLAHSTDVISNCHSIKYRDHDTSTLRNSDCSVRRRTQRLYKTQLPYLITSWFPYLTSQFLSPSYKTLFRIPLFPQCKGLLLQSFKQFHLVSWIRSSIPWCPTLFQTQAMRQMYLTTPEKHTKPSNLAGSLSPRQM